MQSTCSVETCRRHAGTDGLCRPHRERLKNTGSLIRPCARCGSDLPIGTNGRTTLCVKCRGKCGFRDCTEPVRRNGMCASHSHRMFVSGSCGRPCKTCGREIPLSAGVGQRYCSPECKPRCTFDGCSEPCVGRGLCKEHYRRLNHNGSASRRCLTCGAEFPIGKTRGRKYCSDACVPRCIAPGCSDLVEGAEFCPRHLLIVKRTGKLPSYDYECVECGTFVERSYGERSIKPGRKWCPDCQAKRFRSHRWFREQLLERAHVECGICGGQIDLSLEYPHPQSLQVDHIVPLARGGSNSKRNLQPAHQICNYKKGSRLAPPVEGVLYLL